MKGGIRNHPAYGIFGQAKAIFFRKPDGTPWVKFDAGGLPVVSPVTEVGNMLAVDRSCARHSNRNKFLSSVHRMA